MRPNARSSVIVTCLLLGAGSADAIVIRHDVADQAYLSFGQSQFSSVGRMNYEDSGMQVFNGSGTLIGSQWVLTAAHVIEEAADTDWYFETFDGAQQVRSDAVYYHPEWFNDGPIVGDLALVHLSEPIMNIDPTQLIQGATPYGAEVALAGYGGTGDGLTGFDGLFDGQLRAGTNALEFGDPFGFGSEYLSFDFDAPDSGEATDLEAMLMFGDSGGAVMADVNGEWQLIGVHSGILSLGGPGQNWGIYGDLMASTSVEFHRDWINSIIPAPGTTPVLVVGLVVMSRRRRR